MLSCFSRAQEIQNWSNTRLVLPSYDFSFGLSSPAPTPPRRLTRLWDGWAILGSSPVSRRHTPAVARANDARTERDVSPTRSNDGVARDARVRRRRAREDVLHRVVIVSVVGVRIGARRTVERRAIEPLGVPTGVFGRCVRARVVSARGGARGRNRAAV